MKRFLFLFFVSFPLALFAQPNIKGGEYFWGTLDPGAGSGTAFTVADGAWNETVEAMIASAQSVPNISSPNLLNIRIKDVNNNLGPLFKKAVFIGGGVSNTRSVNITYAEYFFGVFDPGAGSGTPLLAFDGAFDDAVESVFKNAATVTFPNGQTLFNVRIKDANNNWGPLFKKALFISGGVTNTRPINITYAEYFFGVFDPGAGAGTAILAFDGAFDDAVESIFQSSATISLPNGQTLFNIRVKDANNNWGPLFKKSIFVNGAVTNTRPINITYAEYFFGVFDPGAGAGTAILAFDGAFDEAIEIVFQNIPSFSLPTGQTLFNIRMKDANNNWGPLFKKSIFVNVGVANTRPINITYAEYFFGVFDPGAGSGTPILALDGSFDESLETVFRNSATWTMASGPTLFNIRLRDAYNNWGPLFKKTVFPYGANPNAELIAQGSTVSICPNTPVTLTYNGPVGYNLQWFNNSTNDTIVFTPSVAGYYHLTATLGASVYTDSIYVDFLQTPAPTTTPSGTILVCASSSIVLSTAQVSGYSYQWYYNNALITSANSVNYLPSQVGNYYVSVTQTSTGCVGTSATVTLATTAIISPSGSVSSCSGNSIVLSASVGSGTSYQWQFNNVNISGAISSTYTPTQSGNYRVVITNGSCSATSANTTVSLSSNFTATISPASSTALCAGSSVLLNASSGTGYIYQWYLNSSPISGATASAYTASAPGNYTVQISNGSCNATSAATVVTVNALPTATITPAAATTFCQGGSVVLNANIGTGLTYQWRLNGTNITGATSSSYTANASGSYTVFVTNATTCSATSTATVVTVNALPTATITPATATTFCQGGSVVLNANTGTGLTYQWRLNGTNITGATSSSYTANESGSYTVVVTNTSTCSATSTATVVTVNALPTATITPATATTFCQGGSVVLNANTGTGLSYQWRLNGTNITGATSSSYTANASGSYTVVVTNTSTCSATSTATVVTVNALPTATITPATATIFCQGGSVVLNANTGTGLTYQWYNNTTIISGATSSSYTANASGSYTVVVTNTSSCPATSSPIVVTANSPNSATITPASATTFCQGGSVVLNANQVVGSTYQWYNNAVAINGATSSSYTASSSGSYTLVISSGASCSSTSAATLVTMNALPTATITAATATTFCQGGSVILNANTGTGLTYQWRLNGTNITGATSSSYTANASGSYTVVVTNTSTCSATSTVTVVTVNALPTATITAATSTTFCQGGSVILNANTGTGLIYQWRLNGTNITGATSSSYTANASGSYTVLVTNTSTCSSTSGATVVTVNALPSATITPATATTFCQGGSVVLNANTGIGLTYQWFNNAVAISGAASSTYTPNASGSYTVVVTNASTCSSTSSAAVVTVNALPSATIIASSATTFCQGGSVVLTANTGTGLTYQWRLNGTNITGATSASYTANANGSYTVVVTNSSTCSSTSSATVVTVNALPTATINPAAATTFCQGGNVVLNANTGTGLTYQWRLNGTNITGATSSSYTANASGSYTVVVTNTSTCSATSSATVVTVNALPSATITPATATTFCQGGSVVLNANTGTVLTYQWFNNAVAISGATSSTYTADVSGSYTVIVTNTSTCSATSTATVVTVNALPAATVTPATATTFCQGGSVVLNANTGAGFMYQWYNNASPISGATSSSYTANASGSYTVGVTNNALCSATSSATNVLVNSNTTYFADADNDGYGNSGNTISTCVQPIGYISNSLDCNDANASINPAAAEICNSTDDNCNSQIDEGLTFTVYYADADGDGFGAGASTSLCSNPGSGYSTNALDCNNSNSSINPSATELCNSADDNCNTQIDEGLIFQNYYQDFDGDGFGFGSPNSLCASQNGYVNNAFDCNDFQAQINPVAQEICNGIDDNCNTLLDDGLQFSNYFLDGDQDGFGSGTPQSFCTNPGNGYSQVNTDCNDAVAVINPSAIEICNSIDDNCNLQIDEGLVFTNYFADNDGDGFGNPTQVISSCSPLNGMVTNNGDCNDANANINPLAEEIGANGIDENCDGQIDNSIFELNATISLYPNPTRSELNIQVNSSIIGNDLYIFDAVGKLVYKQQLLSTQTTVPVSNFADGNYVLRVGEVVKRFVVQK